MESRKYPGRDRVISRDSARDYLYRDKIGYGASKHPCSQPRVIHAIGLPSQFEANRDKLPVEMMARCRKCPECLAHRRRLWTARAVDEIAVSSRSWFGTLTVKPYERFRYKLLAERKLQRRGGLPDGQLLSSLSSAEQFPYLAAELGSEVTRYLKRVRKAGFPLRYLLVAEAHKSGDPHFHILIHEQGLNIPKRELEAQWRIGFSHWRLVERDSSAAVYVCKYLSKDARTRVRASQSYGQVHKVKCITERALRATHSILRSDANGRERGAQSSGVDARGPVARARKRNEVK